VQALSLGLVDVELSDLPYLAVSHPAVPAVFGVACLLLGGAAWWLAPQRGWAQVPAALAGCGLALALAVTVIRPMGKFPAGGLDPLTTLQECTLGALSLVRTYEKLNVAMLVPYTFFGTLATRRPAVVAASGLLISGLLEFVQGSTGGGTCQVRDLVHNTAGGLLGALLAVLLLRRLNRLDRLDRQRAALTAGRGAGSESSS
jgi:hypothetical protein